MSGHQQFRPAFRGGFQNNFIGRTPQQNRRRPQYGGFNENRLSQHDRKVLDDLSKKHDKKTKERERQKLAKSILSLRTNDNKRKRKHKKSKKSRKKRKYDTSSESNSSSEASQSSPSSSSSSSSESDDSYYSTKRSKRQLKKKRKILKREKRKKEKEAENNSKNKQTEKENQQKSTETNYTKLNDQLQQMQQLLTLHMNNTINTLAQPTLFQQHHSPPITHSRTTNQHLRNYTPQPFPNFPNTPITSPTERTRDTTTRNSTGFPRRTMRRCTSPPVTRDSEEYYENSDRKHSGSPTQNTLEPGEIVEENKINSEYAKKVQETYQSFKTDDLWKSIYTPLCRKFKSDTNENTLSYYLAFLKIPSPIPIERIPCLKHLTHHFISQNMNMDQVFKKLEEIDSTNNFETNSNITIQDLTS